MPPPVILAYHAVREVPRSDDPYNLAVRPGRVRQHALALRRWGYRLVTFGELASAVATGDAEDLAALTFDDGYDDNLHELVPVLRELDAPATVFVTAGLLGGRHPDVPDWPIMTADEVRRLAEAGIEVGSHGWAHADLLTVDDLTEELERSRERLQELTGQPVDTIAYPYGRADERVADAAAAAGYRAGGMTSGEGAWDRPLQLPRQDGTRGMTVPGLWLRTRETYEPIVATLPGRLVRRAVHEVTGRRG